MLILNEKENSKFIERKWGTKGWRKCNGKVGNNREEKSQKGERKVWKEVADVA